MYVRGNAMKVCRSLRLVSSYVARGVCVPRRIFICHGIGRNAFISATRHIHNTREADYDINAILTVEIPRVEKDIMQVEEEMKEVVQLIQNKKDVEFNRRELDYLRQKKHDLRQKKHDLRQKEHDLRQEMIQLQGKNDKHVLSKFEFKIEDNSNFPLYGGGKILFWRDHFVKKVASMVLEKPEEEGMYLSHYWRAPVGSGKTVFLRLVGRELTTRGYDVYMTSGYKLDTYEEHYFTNLAKQAGDKPVVLLIDDVHINLTGIHWVDLLKEYKPRNLVVLGVGLHRLGMAFTPSPQFDKNYPEDKNLFPMFFTVDDLPEVIDCFGKMYPTHPKNVITEVCQRMLTFTSGHPYPFVRFVNHLLESKQVLDVEIMDKYLSSEEFWRSDVRKEIGERCFSDLEGDLLNKATDALLKGKSVRELEKLGIWNNYALISPLVQIEVFMRFVVHQVDANVVTLDETEEKAPYAQQIISTGLRDMSEEQFKDVCYTTEDAIGFKWALEVRRCMPSIWVAAQVRTAFNDHAGPGSEPNIDYFFINGHVNMGIELALNASASSLMEHLERFENKYKTYIKNRIVFHIDTKNDTLVTVDWKKEYPVYTFLKKRNELYRNSHVVQRNVSKALPSPLAGS